MGEYVGAIMGMYADRWDSLIRYWCGILWEPQDWRLIKAQIGQESAFNPLAVSPVGAGGLMQLMPATALEQGCRNVFDPEQNVMAGIKYLKYQFAKFPEIPNPQERIKYALASYNCGRGHVNHAIQQEIVDNGRTGLKWQEWCNVVDELPEITGPVNARQTTDYVNKIMAEWTKYKTLN